MVTEVKYEFKDQGFDRLEAIDKRLSKFDAHFLKVEKGMGRASAGGGKMTDILAKFNVTGSKSAQIMDSMAGQLPVLGEGAAALVNPYTAAAAAIIAVGKALYEAGRFAETWDLKMKKINVTAQLSKRELSLLSDAISETAQRYGTDFMAVPEAYNQIISGVGDANKSLDILDKSLKASEAGFTDVTVAADAAVNVMNSVGNTTAKETFDVLFATLNKGKAEFQDIAQYLPKVIPYSNQLGLSFKETSAAFALLTAKGQSVEQTATLLENAYRAIGDPEKRKRLEQVVKVFDHGKIRPFVDIVGDLEKKFEGISDQERIRRLGTLGLDSEAGAAFSVLMQNADAFREFNTYVQNSSQGIGALEQAYQDSANSTRDWNTAINMLKGGFLWIGQQVKPIWDEVAGGIVDALKWLRALEERTGIFGALFTGIGKGVKLVWDLVTWPFRTLWKLLKGGMELADAMFRKLTGGGKSSISIFDRLTTILSDIVKIAGYAADALSHLLNFEFRKAKDDWENIEGKIRTFGVVIDPNAKQMTGQSYYQQMAKSLPKDIQDKIAEKIAANNTSQKKSAMPGDEANKWGLPDKKGKGGSSSGDGMRGVAGGGSQPRNIYITIQKQVESVTINTTNISGDRNLKRQLEELLVDAARNAEVTLSN